MKVLEQRSIRRVPLVLPAVAGIEMWERFSFYGMQAILAYYLYSTSDGLGMEQTQATALVGAYGSLLYLFTFVGGWVSDRLLGAERTLLTGAGLLVCGHFSLSLIPGTAGLIIGLLPLALGSGLLKTAAITILGAAFPAEAGARDGVFQIFYLGINIGALFGPMLTGWLAEEYGYHAGFFAAAVLMCCGCATYGALRKKIDAPTRPPHPTQAPGKAGLVALAALLAGVLIIITVSPATLTMLLLIATVAAAAGLFASMLRSSRVTADERRRILDFIPLFACSTAYWTLQPQIYGVLAVYSDQRLNRSIGGFEIPRAWTQSLNPLFILLLSLPLAAGMTRWANSRRARMGCGIIFAGAGMFLLLPLCGRRGKFHAVPGISGHHLFDVARRALHRPSGHGRIRRARAAGICHPLFRAVLPHHGHRHLVGRFDVAAVRYHLGICRNDLPHHHGRRPHHPGAGPPPAAQVSSYRPADSSRARSAMSTSRIPLNRSPIPCGLDGI